MIFSDSLCPSEMAAELEEYMDEEFSTILEDNSNSQIADELIKFHKYLIADDEDSIRKDLEILQKQNTCKKVTNSSKTEIIDSDKSKDVNNTMDVDNDGWTLVNKKR